MSEVVDSGDGHVEIDERYWDEWIQWGIVSFEKSLRNHAQFDDYCRKREEEKADE